MTKKYIIKNCPALLISGICNGRNVKGLACKNNTNCLLKQIVEKCRDVSGYSDFAFGQRDKADEILSILEIEECKE